MNTPWSLVWTRACPAAFHACPSILPSRQFEERIWSKTGMEHDAYYVVGPNGLTLGLMGVNSSLRDMALFGRVSAFSR